MNKIFRNSATQICFWALTLVFLNCDKKAQSPAIACVGKSILTVDDLNKSIPPEYSAQITMEQHINYVKQWIDMELLFQEALRKKIDKDKDIKSRLYKMKRDLLCSELLNIKSLQNKSSSIDNNAIHSFYELNKEQYQRENNLVKFLEIVVEDSRIAWNISKNSTYDNFLTFAAEYSRQPVPENPNSPLVEVDSLPPEIQQAVASTPAGTATNPIKTDLGYHVLFIIEKLEKGGICKEEEIRDEIISCLSTKIQKENIDAFLADLRLKTNITFNSDLIKKVSQNNDTTTKLNK